MAEKNVHYKSEEMMTRKQLASFLRDLADRLESNSLRLAQDDSEVDVDLPERVGVEVKYQTKPKDGETEHQLELEIEWGPGSEGVRLA
jgi:amphi-Trp domain-containing protein